MNKFKKLVQTYKTDNKGNVSAMFAVSFLGSFIAAGAAIDLALISKNQNQLQNLTDAAVLAALQYDGSIAEKKEAFKVQLNELSRLSGRTHHPVAKQLSITENETSLVLKVQVESNHDLVLLDQLNTYDSYSVFSQADMGIEDVEISLVLDISSSMNGFRITEAKSSSKFFIDELMGNQSLTGRVSIALVPFGGTVRVPVEMANLLDTPLEHLEDYSKHWIDGEWNQCFEFDADDTKEGILPDGQYRVTPDYYSWNSNNPWCPRAGNEMVPLSQDAKSLKDTIDNLSLSDGTGSDHGMAWGFETLNSAWKNKFPGGLKDKPADNKAKTRKVIVFMSDGGITSQHYVRDQDQIGGNPPYDSHKKQRVNFNDSLSAFYGACDRAKALNMEVFTIGYNLRNNNQATQIKNCATSEVHYIDAFNGDLDKVFGGIASAISPLRVTN